MQLDTIYTHSIIHNSTHFHNMRHGPSKVKMLRCIQLNFDVIRRRFDGLSGLGIG